LINKKRTMATDHSDQVIYDGVMAKIVSCNIIDLVATGTNLPFSVMYNSKPALMFEIVVENENGQRGKYLITCSDSRSYEGYYSVYPFMPIYYRLDGHSTLPDTHEMIFNSDEGLVVCPYIKTIPESFKNFTFNRIEIKHTTMDQPYYNGEINNLLNISFSNGVSTATFEFLQGSHYDCPTGYELWVNYFNFDMSSGSYHYPPVVDDDIDHCGESHGFKYMENV
jgi:hypothetical protein